MVVAELEKTLSSFPVVDSVVSLLDGVVEKLSALKRKVGDAYTHSPEQNVSMAEIFRHEAAVKQSY